MSFKVRIQAKISDSNPLGDANEDLIVFLNNLIVLMDGATGLRKPGEKIEFDAGQFVRMVARELLETWAPGKDFKVSLRCALERVQMASVSKLASIREKHLLPSAGLTAFHISGNKGFFYRIGDCGCLLFRRGLVIELFEESPLADLDKSVVEYINNRIRSGESVDQARGAALSKLIKNRSKMNTLKGYGALTTNPSCLDFLEIIECQLQTGDMILLASDGFTAMSSLYKLYEREDFFNDPSDEKYASFVKKMREQERSDSDLMEFPRIKQFDDASAVLACLIPETV